MRNTVNGYLQGFNQGVIMAKPFLSICIPSYNRPRQLLRLLRTIDTRSRDIQIVICEDKAPKRLEVRQVVDEFKKDSPYEVKYIENDVNKGFDWNVRDFIIQADGEYNMYMGDDDGFMPEALDKLLDFLRGHRELGFILRSSRTCIDGELMKYFPETTFFEPGMESYVALFRKCVFISGFTYKREWARDSMTDGFDGSLLYQAYILGEICVNHPSAYFDVPLTHAYPNQEISWFGSSEKEKGLYVPGKISAESQLNFVGSFLKISRFLDEKYKFNSTPLVQKDVAKYSYPILEWVQRKSRFEMLKCAYLLKKAGLGCSIYFYIYILALFTVGPKFCGKCIGWVKKRLGRTPRL